MIQRTFPTLLLLVLCACGGCNTQLEKGGVYEGRNALYQADKTIVETYDMMDRFLRWEHENRAVLDKYPDIKKAADTIRTDGRTWLRSAIEMREAYANSPTKENATQLENSIAVLRSLLTQIAAHMSREPQLN